MLAGRAINYASCGTLLQVGQHEDNRNRGSTSNREPRTWLPVLARAVPSAPTVARPSFNRVISSTILLDQLTRRQVQLTSTSPLHSTKTSGYFSYLPP